MFQEIIFPIFRSTRLCVTACGIIKNKKRSLESSKRLSYIEDARCLKVNIRRGQIARFVVQQLGASRESGTKEVVCYFSM